MSDHDHTVTFALAESGIHSEKATSFLSYVLGRILFETAMENDDQVQAAMKECADLLPGAAFPFKQSSGRMLTIPAGIVLEELLYTDKAMTLFFMNFVGFCFLLLLLKKKYPAVFRLVAAAPGRIPAPYSNGSKQAAERIFSMYAKSTAPADGQADADEPGINPLSARAAELYRLVLILAESRYLPLGMDHAPYNREIFSMMDKTSDGG